MKDVPALYRAVPKINTQEVSTIKTITKDEVSALVKHGIIRNTREGLIGKDGWPAGYTTTRNKAYIQEKYADIGHLIVYKNRGG